MNPTSCLFGSRFVGPFFLLAGALLFEEKIRQSAALFWFGLRDVGMFVRIQTAIQASRRLDSFLYEAAQNFKVF
jgi:hypothetical protein